MMVPILSLVTFLPLAGALLLIFFPADRIRLVRSFALGVAVLTFLLSLVLYFGFDSGTALPQFVEQRAWLGRGIQYHVGIDGISLFLVLLTTFLMPVALLASWGGIGERVKEFSFFMLFLETGLIGVFVSLNLFLFYVFWEAMLIPMYFIIGIWGGRRRVYATLKFVLFTMFGSLLMLVAILVLYAQYHRATGVYSFSILDYCGLSLGASAQTWLFLAFALAFAVKIPLFPLHTWLPDAHVEAPTPGSVILAAVLLKMGAYGFIRFALPFFPDATRRFLPWLSLLAAVGIIYGGLMALVQKDMKSLVAYSSVSHMGLIMLAVFSLNFEALEGALFQMINHGLSTGALFLCVGYPLRTLPHPADQGLRRGRPPDAGLFGALPYRYAFVDGTPGAQRVRRRDPLFLRDLHLEQGPRGPGGRHGRPFGGLPALAFPKGDARADRNESVRALQGHREKGVGVPRARDRPDVLDGHLPRGVPPEDGRLGRKDPMHLRIAKSASP